MIAPAHRAHADSGDDVLLGAVRYAPLKSAWITGMACAAVVGGAAGVESEPGQGCRFWIELPAAERAWNEEHASDRASA